MAKGDRVVWIALAVVVVLIGGWFGIRYRGQHWPAPMTMRIEQFFLDNPVRRRFFSPERLWQVTGSLEGLTVGEIGVGVGVVMEQLARRVGSDGRVYGIDIQAEAVWRTRERLKKLKLIDQVSLQEASATRLPWPDQGLDWVFLVTVFGEIPVPERALALAEVGRVLKPHGRLGILEYWPDPHFQPEAKLSQTLLQNGFVVEQVIGTRIIYALTARREERR
ncbi:MAG: hypothetical protein C7B45_10730 [Sulfobacillus acidophilus]|uniref:Methyltransferase domain-containing protein n=1 Tax=Sulfobacillus acidophilus TaxID=53633 RepID=A0A2T2WGY1_9FIRM|nr:MAG: hypothetical protein C7B45_10730 [Sulfobacillus acidophilus]